MQTISLCMIVKNEEKFIEQCLSSVISIVSEIIIVDTGSTDKTLLLAEPFHPKIYKYNWDNDFGSARNYSLAQATGDWILVLDADESIYNEDLEKLNSIIQTTKYNGIGLKFHNFIEENSEENYNTHIGVRVFRNHYFYYKGCIHEQLTSIHDETPYNIQTTDIRVRHYGYLKSNAGEKKHNRNVPIIQKLLDENPNDSFQLFNMGNEYMSQGDYSKALEYFEKSYLNKDVTLAYCPHLIFRRAACLHYLQRNQESLSILEEGSRLYPKCSDYEYLKGRIYKVLKRYSLATDSLNKCICMGPSPLTLSFVSDIEGFKAYVELGHIYFLQDDFEKSLSYYLKALQTKNNHYELIYKIGEVLNKMFCDKKKVCENLENLFADGFYISNVLVMVDVLLNERLYPQAQEYFKRVKGEEHLEDIHYLNGRLFFYRKEYEAAFNEFIKVLCSSNKKNLLPEIRIRSLEYGIICILASKQNKLSGCNSEQIQTFINELDIDDEKQILYYFLKKEKTEFKNSAKKNIYRILSEILKVGEFDLFEKNLEILNLIDSNEVLLDLAAIFYKNGYKDVAFKNIMRSIKELGVINADAVYLLNKEFLLPES